MPAKASPRKPPYSMYLDDIAEHPEDHYNPPPIGLLRILFGDVPSDEQVALDYARYMPAPL